MNPELYNTILLPSMPEHNTYEFNNYLLLHNKVVKVTDYWIMVENIKYHKYMYPHYTVFAKRPVQDFSRLNPEELKSLQQITKKYKGWFTYINSIENQSIKRFHIHLVANQNEWIRVQYNLLQKEK